MATPLTFVGQSIGSGLNGHPLRPRGCSFSVQRRRRRRGGTARPSTGWPIPEGARIETPAGYAEFPKKILRPPRSVAERTYANIQRWTAMEKGGHFVALEQPEALAREIRAFFRPLR